jgi:hypothetical protein
MLSSHIWSFVPFVAGSRCLGVVQAEAMVGGRIWEVGQRLAQVDLIKNDSDLHISLLQGKSETDTRFCSVVSSENGERC